MNSDFVTRKEFDTAIQEIRSLIHEILETQSKLSALDTMRVGEPPLHPRKSRASKGRQSFDLRVRIDKALYDLLVDMALKHHGGNLSRCLDVVLWQYFNKPPMSWEGKNGR